MRVSESMETHVEDDERRAVRKALEVRRLNPHNSYKTETRQRLDDALDREISKIHFKVPTLCCSYTISNRLLLAGVGVY